MITLLGKKKGMGAVFDDAGRHTPVTLLEIGPCPVVQIKSEARDGYQAVQIGYGSIRPKLLTKPLAGHFKRAGVKFHRLLREFRHSSEESPLKVGDVLRVDHFKPGDTVTVSGISKGRGFAGVIKRHKFRRPVQGHGTHESFRGHGSIGQHSFPARVWPGKKMAGRMGGRRITVKNLLVMGVEPDKGLLMIKGAVPGAAGNYISIRKTG